jgi:uncharacterized membrane protein
MSILIALSTWLHTLATLIMVGYYVFTCLIFIPVLERRFQVNDLRDILKQVADRLQPYFGAALLIFLVTGTYLMLINQSYLGLGRFFANPWSVLIVVKHVLVLAFLAVAVISERIFFGQKSDQKPEAMSRFQLALRTNLALGVLIILLTSIAQAA